MSDIPDVNYTKKFEVSTLPRIHGEPDYSKLKVLKDLLKANSSRVQSDLGGGAHGHLGLVLTPVEYAAVSATPYVCPPHPGPLVIPQGTTNHALTVLCEQHKKALSLFHQTIDLDNALKKQITDALDEPYYKDLKDPVTNSITHSIPYILQYLFTNFGDVESETLQKEAERVRTMKFSIQNQLTDLYQQIKDLEQLARATPTPFTPAQLVDIAITVIKGTGDYQQALHKWYQLPIANRTYATLKTHFSCH